MKWPDDVETKRTLGMEIWRQKGVNTIRWTSVVEDVMDLRGPQY